MKITKDNVNHFLLGSLYGGTGGGFPLAVHTRMMQEIFDEFDEISIVDFDELKPNDELCSVYGVGDPSKANVDFRALIKTSLKRYEQLTGSSIKAIIAGEVGAEGLAFQAAAYLGLPVVDTDLVGGRAAPEIQMDVFSAYKLSVTPSLGVTADGKEMLLTGAFEATDVERYLRNLFSDNGSAGLLIGYPITVRELAKKAIPQTLSGALKLGEVIAAGRLLTTLDQFGIQRLAEARLTETNVESQDGFLKGWLQFEGHRSIWVKNENIRYLESDQEKVTAPDLINLVTTEGQPIHNTEVAQFVGHKVVILASPGQGYWQEPAARTLWESAKS